MQVGLIKFKQNVRKSNQIYGRMASPLGQRARSQFRSCKAVFRKQTHSALNLPPYSPDLAPCDLFINIFLH